MLRLLTVNAKFDSTGFWKMLSLHGMHLRPESFYLSILSLSPFVIIFKTIQWNYAKQTPVKMS